MSWFWIVSWFLIVIAFFGNALVTYLIITRRRLHTKTNWYVLSLAVADLILVVFLTLPIYFCGTLIRNCSDAIVHFTSYFGEASVTNIIALTVDRYCAIVLPLRYTQIMTKKKIVVILITSWLTPLILDTVPSVLLPEVLSNGEEIAQLTSMVIFQISPCFFLMIATIKMITVASKHSRRTSVLLKQLRFNQPTNRAKAETSSARVTSVMVGIFLICYVSQSLSSLCSCFSSCKKAQPTKVVGTTLMLLLIANSGVNPFVYALFKRDVKRELYQMFCCRKQRKREQRRGTVNLNERGQPQD